MKYGCLFWLLIPGTITVLLLSTSISVFSSTPANNTVLQQAQKSLEENQKQLAIVSSEPVPNVVPSAVQEIHGTSFVEGVFFTWVIISSDNEVSINLHYIGDGTTPPVSVAATAQTKSPEVTMKGNTVMNAGWASPNTVSIIMNGKSSLYDSTAINVVASPLGSSQSTVKTLSDKPTTSTNQIKQPSVSSTANPKADFVNSNFAILFANPDDYLGSTIDVTGKVANFPEAGLLQMYIEGAVRHDAVVHYNASFGFVEDDCVKVTGIVEEQFYGTNAFSATRIVPSISARTIEKIDCNQAINPALKTVVLEKTQIKGGIKVVFHKVEFSDKNTRVYLTVENLNRKVGITFYDFDAKAFQGNRQYTTVYSFDVDYPSIKSDIPPGIREDGVVLFNPLSYKVPIAKFQFKATRSDTYTTFDFIFPVAIPK